MEITSEIKAKVFAQYLWRYIKSNGKKFKMTITETSNTREKSLFFAVDNITQLILKPLSSITDEDAIEVAKFQGCNSIELLDLKLMKQEISNCFNYENNYNESFLTNITIFQFLQFHGYDLPNYLLGGKTLQEAGLAIYL